MIEVTEIKHIPEDFLPYIKVKHLSPDAIRLGDWDADIYAGCIHAPSGHRVRSMWVQRQEENYPSDFSKRSEGLEGE